MFLHTTTGIGVVWKRFLKRCDYLCKRQPVSLVFVFLVMLCSCQPKEEDYEPHGIRFGRSKNKTTDVDLKYISPHGLAQVLESLFGEFEDQRHGPQVGGASFVVVVEPDFNAKSFFEDIARFLDNPAVTDLQLKDPASLSLEHRFYYAIYLFTHRHDLTVTTEIVQKFLISVVTSAPRDSLFSAYGYMLLAYMAGLKTPRPRDEIIRYYSIVAKNEVLPAYIRFGAASQLGFEMQEANKEKEAVKAFAATIRNFPQFKRWPLYRKAQLLLDNQNP
jgi:hypothetical protein